MTLDSHFPSPILTLSPRRVSVTAPPDGLGAAGPTARWRPRGSLLEGLGCVHRRGRSLPIPDFPIPDFPIPDSRRPAVRQPRRGCATRLPPMPSLTVLGQGTKASGKRQIVVARCGRFAVVAVGGPCPDRSGSARPTPTQLVIGRDAATGRSGFGHWSASFLAPGPGRQRRHHRRFPCGDEMPNMSRHARRASGRAWPSADSPHRVHRTGHDGAADGRVDGRR